MVWTRFLAPARFQGAADTDAGHMHRNRQATDDQRPD